jgi:hypothetical protein
MVEADKKEALSYAKASFFVFSACTSLQPAMGARLWVVETSVVFTMGLDHRYFLL